MYGRQHDIGTDAYNGLGGIGGKTNAFLYDYDLVGDDFFLELAKIDLECSSENRKSAHPCDACDSFGFGLIDCCF